MSRVVYYNSTPAGSDKEVPIRILFTDNNPMILQAIKDEHNAITRSGTDGKWLSRCYQIDYYQGDIVPLAIGKDPFNDNFHGMITNAAFVSPANSKGHMGGGIDYPLNYKMFPQVAINVKAANQQLGERFYAAQDRHVRNDFNDLIPSYVTDVDENTNDDGIVTDGDTIVLVNGTDSNKTSSNNSGDNDVVEYETTDSGPWYGPLFDAIGQAFMPVGSASISPTQQRGERPNGRNQYLVSAPTMYNPGSSIAGTGNAGAAVFATLACVQKYNRLLARVNVPIITTIVLPGMGTGVGGMGPSEYAREAFAALKDYSVYYLGYQQGATALKNTPPVVPDHMIDLVPDMNRFFLRDPGYFLRKQRPGYGMQDFDICYQLMPRPDPEVERLKALRPTGGLFGSGSVGSGGMFDHNFGMSGFAGSGGLGGGVGEFNVGGNFAADPEFHNEIQKRLAEEEEDRKRRAEQGSDDDDDLGAEERMLERMAAMANRRDKIDKEIERRNEEMIANGNPEMEEFLRERDPRDAFDPNDPTQNMSFEARLASHMIARDEDMESVIKPMTTETGDAMDANDMQARFQEMMMARNNELFGLVGTPAPTILTEEEQKAADKESEAMQIERERQFREMMSSRNKVMSDPNSLTGMWH